LSIFKTFRRFINDRVLEEAVKNRYPEIWKAVEEAMKE
jgi:hypothetical protein